MVAKISHGGSFYGALSYNQEKVDEGLGKVLGTNMVLEPADGMFNAAACVEDFERLMPSHIRTKKPVIHVSLNPHPDDKLTDQQLTDMGWEYMQKLGYGDQPYMIFKHEDIDRQHIHIVASRVKSNGKLISDKYEKERSAKIVSALEKDYNLIQAKGQNQGEAWQLSPINAGARNLKKQIANVIKPLNSMYRFSSLAEYRALLSLYNIGVEKIEGENKGNPYRGLVYSALNEKGFRAGKPLKSSLFGKALGIEALEAKFPKTKEEIKAGGFAANTRKLVSAPLESSANESEFRAALQEKGIDVVLRRNKEGRIFGATYIDHNERTVLNGSALGKEFSANALNERFADGSLREDLHAPTVTTPMQPPASIPKQPDHSKAPTGGMLSVLTPETGRGDDNQQQPKPRKKRKRRYGRQL